MTAKGLCVICFKKIRASMSQCRLLSTMRKMERKICRVNDCNRQQNYLLHMEHGKVTVNMFTVLDKEDEEGEEDEEAKEDKPASKDEEEDESPGARLMRGILEAGRSPKEAQENSKDSSEGLEEAKEKAGATSEDKVKLEPEKEKNPQSQSEKEKEEYCCMEAIADRWRDKPK